MGLDVGNRRIGVAISDASKLIARPLEVIDRGRDGRDDAAALGRLVRLFAEYRPDEIVVGEPRRTDGRPSAQTDRVLAFVAQAQIGISAEFVFTDERYSTQEARAIMAGRRGGLKRADADDAVAAAVILQRHLDRSQIAEDEEGFGLG